MMIPVQVRMGFLHVSTSGLKATGRHRGVGIDECKAFVREGERWRGVSIRYSITGTHSEQFGNVRFFGSLSSKERDINTMLT